MPPTPVLNILIVDDDDDLREQLALACEMLGHRTEILPTAAQALERLAAKPLPDLMLSDVRMPDMDGISLLRELNRLQLRLPVVVISGHADRELSAQALELGAVDFLEKPFGLAAIRGCLARLAGTGEAPRNG